MVWISLTIRLLKKGKGENWNWQWFNHRYIGTLLHSELKLEILCVKKYKSFKDLHHLMVNLNIMIVIILRVKGLERLMMKPENKLCPIFWIVLVDLTRQLSHASSNHHHVVNHICNRYLNILVLDIEIF